ncbi:MAG: preprotein translocase subunit YajC [Bdellovibrionales bacterium]|nr:preprotein translocase subunit YajC [Bdellovibrionales bacterium]
MFSSIAYAQAATSAAAGPGMIEQLVPFIAIFAIFYFLIIRPQSKRQKDHQSFLLTMKRGDSVITTGGIYGKIEGLSDKFVTLEVSDGVNIRILKSQIASSVNEGASNAQ